MSRSGAQYPMPYGDKVESWSVLGTPVQRWRAGRNLWCDLLRGASLGEDLDLALAPVSLVLDLLLELDLERWRHGYDQKKRWCSIRELILLL